ncbi:MAG: hypothetical protein RR263_04855, partial [Oscillospiraceae bacterium]
MNNKETIIKLSSGALACVIFTMSIVAAAAQPQPIITATEPLSDNGDGAVTTSEQSKTNSQNSGMKKSETVYVNLNADGSVRETIVSDWLHSDKANVTVTDKTDLTDIQNIKGNEKPKRSDDTLTWQLTGNDVYYQGKSNKALPLEVSISYYLDGKKMTPQEIAGKSGKMEMHLSFHNTTSYTVDINGKPSVIHMPLSVVTALALPDDHFSNVQVSDGAVLSDGNNQAVSIMVMPGLSESLNLGSYS